MKRRIEILCCTKCRRPADYPELTPELIETPDGLIKGFRCYSICCIEDLEHEPACITCSKQPQQCEDQCIACAVAFFSGDDREFADAADMLAELYPAVYAAVVAGKRSAA